MHWVKLALTALSRKSSISLLMIFFFHSFTETNYSETILRALLENYQLYSPTLQCLLTKVHQSFDSRQRINLCVRLQSAASVKDWKSLFFEHWTWSQSHYLAIISARSHTLQRLYCPALRVHNFTATVLIHPDAPNWLILTTEMEIHTLSKQERKWWKRQNIAGILNKVFFDRIRFIFDVIFELFFSTWEELHHA